MEPGIELCRSVAKNGRLGTSYPVLRMNILIVDDKPNLVQVTAVALRTLGCRTFGASTSSAATKLLETEKIDAVFLDINLGGENGLDFLSRLTARSKTPVIVFTAHTRDEVAGEALERGALGCLLKPFTLDDLRRQVAQIKQFHQDRRSIP
jgi:DNA-binding response OmpR family regulator